MRKYLTLVLGLVVAFGCVNLGVASAFTTTQHIDGSVTPKKLPKDKRAPAKLFIDVSGTTDNPNGVPAPTTLAKVDFDKDVAFYQKGLDTCDPSQFTSATTTQQAKTACGPSQIGVGTGNILIPTGPSTPPLKVNAVITVFNGKHKTIVLHTYNSLSGAQTLVGQLGPADAAAGRVATASANKKYGITLTVQVPPLAGGTAVIQEFNATIKKTFRYKGKKRSLFSAKCGSDKKIRFQARFTYSDGTSSTGTHVQKCKQKG
jgi:hypothetical protein